MAKSRTIIHKSHTYKKERPRTNSKTKMTTTQNLNKQFNDISFHEIASCWLSYKKSRIKESSYVKYSNTIRVYLNPVFGDLQIERIKRADVSNFCIYLSGNTKDRHKRMSPKTINDVLSVLKSIFRYAVEEKRLDVVSLSGISIKIPYKPMRILSITEQKKLEEILRKNITPCHLGILLCLYTGLRIGEICSLTWGDISMYEPILNVTKTMQRIQQVNGELPKTKIVISAPKSSYSVRKIPLPEEIYRLLQEQRRDSEAYLLTGECNRYVEPRSLENNFRKVLSNAGIGHMNYHALRHTFATRCIELGFDIKSLSEILGHSSVNITLNKYVHPTMELKQKNMNKLSDLFTDN